MQTVGKLVCSFFAGQSVAWTRLCTSLKVPQLLILGDSPPSTKDEHCDLNSDEQSFEFCEPELSGLIGHDKNQVDSGLMTGTLEACEYRHNKTHVRPAFNMSVRTDRDEVAILSEWTILTLTWDVTSSGFQWHTVIQMVEMKWSVQ